jgi:hypothetical protein
VSVLVRDKKAVPFGGGKAFGELVEQFDGKNQRTTQTYDVLGRMRTRVGYFDMPDAERGTEHSYNPRGYLEYVKEAYIDPSPSVGQVVYIKNQSMDALGNITSKKLGNRTITRTHDQATGRLKSALSMNGVVSATADNLVLGYDELGNLKSRHRSSGDPYFPSMQTNESYCYDTLNRLIKTHTGTLSGSCGGTADTTYDAFGNLRGKNVLTYNYPTGAGAVRPHAVSNVKTSESVTIAAYTYDTNGNMTGDTSGRTFTYSVFDQMTQVQKGTTDTLRFTYGADRQRNYRKETVGSSTTKTFYMGSAERVELPSGTKEIRRRIGNEVVVIHTVDGSETVTSTKHRYQMVDHLGSPVAVYDGNAIFQEHLSFGTWGDRRNFDTTLPPLLPYTNITTDTVRGYTGHEHGDAFGIIHMNGRIYDLKEITLGVIDI